MLLAPVDLEPSRPMRLPGSEHRPAFEVGLVRMPYDSIRLGASCHLSVVFVVVAVDHRAFMYESFVLLRLFELLTIDDSMMRGPNVEPGQGLLFTPERD